jgi:hypothetical protein
MIHLINKLEEMKAEIDDLEKDFSEHTLDKLVNQHYESSNGNNTDDKLMDFDDVLENDLIPKKFGISENIDRRKSATLTIPGDLIRE